MLGFMGLTMAVVLGGVEDGIELVPPLDAALIATLIALGLYVLTLEGALGSRSICSQISTRYCLATC